MLDLSRIPSLADALRDALLTFKSRVALLEADRQRESARFSYRELQLEAERVAAHLQAAGIEAGDRCAILMSNQARWVISSHAVLFAGAVVVPIDYKLTAKEQLALLAHAKPKLLITEYGIWRSLLRADESVAGKLFVIVSEAKPNDALSGAMRWEAPAHGRFHAVARTRSDIASIVYSSGTGGTPKGCMLTHDNYLEQAQALGRMYTMEPDDVYFSVLPTNHAIDFMCGTILPFLFGAAVAHQRTLRPEFLADTMKRFRVTHTALVPRILKTLRERIEEQLEALPEWQRTAVHALTQVNDLATLRAPKPWLSRALLKPIHDRFGGRLRLVFAGGAYVEPELALYFYRIGLPVVIGYGLSEACTVLTLNDLQPFRADSVGRVLPGTEIVLRDVDREGVGEVCVRSRTVMQGYYDNAEATREAFADGFLCTGDLGKLDASGHLKLFGRKKNMVVTEGGKNVYPEDIEAAFESVPCEELCVFAERYLWPASALRAENLCVVLRPKRSDGAHDPHHALDALRIANRKLAAWKRVSSYALLDEEFPRTASMKIKRALLAERVRALVNAPSALSETERLES
jgi:long-chain acyl-CoA synthetase